jgi:Uma2 family endonuclease
MQREKIATGSPDIAFEVVSSDRADRLQFKIDSYLEHGSQAVCCIYPAQKRITVLTAASQWFEFHGDVSLEFPSILPGFSVPLTAIFAGTG